MQGCPHCGHEMFKPTPDGLKIKTPTSMLVLHKSGDVEINCPKCKQGVLVPLVAKAGEVALKKAAASQRFVVRKAHHKTGA